MKRKLPPKEVRFERAIIVCKDDKKEIANLHFAIIPDHYNENAERWKKADARGVIVRTRSRIAELYRDWRKAGGKAEPGVAEFATCIAWLIVKMVDEAHQKHRSEGGLAQ